MNTCTICKGAGIKPGFSVPYEFFEGNHLVDALCDCIRKQLGDLEHRTSILEAALVAQARGAA